MLRSLLGKVDHMQEQMGNTSRERKHLKKNQKKMLEIKSTAKELKNALTGSLTGWTHPRKELMSLKNCR